MISYEPLWKYLANKGISTARKLAEEVGLAPATASRLMKNGPVTIDVIDRVCEHFGLGVAQVMVFKNKEEDYFQTYEDLMKNAVIVFKSSKEEADEQRDT